jgi:hypothetical protein
MRLRFWQAILQCGAAKGRCSGHKIASARLKGAYTFSKQNS